MYDFVARNKLIVQIILGIMVLPFAFFGVDSYFRSGGKEEPLVTVSGQKITQFEYDNAMRDQQARFQQMLGQNYRPEMFDTPEARRGILDGLIQQKLVEQQSKSLRFIASDELLQKTIAATSAFHENGAFSGKKYQEILASQGMSPLMYEQRMRQALSQQPLQDAIYSAQFASNTSAQQWLNLFEQTREIQIAQLEPAAFLAQIQPAETAIKSYYDSNSKDFQSPEQVKLEYLVLAQSSIASQLSVSEEEINKAYAERSKEFATAEERKASHILIAGKGKSESKKKAEDLLAQIQAKPERFAELAKANSEDPGSKDNGGDLGFFGKGAMVKPFELASFEMKKDEVRGPIETDFGYHIIKLTDIKPSVVPPLAELRPKIEADLKNRQASQQFGKLAEKFQADVYTQSDNFKVIATEAKLTPVTSQWLSRPQLQAIAMGNKKLVDAVFNGVKDKKNTEAVEIATNTLMSARVLDHKPAAIRAYEEVKPEIVSILKRKEASSLATKLGAEKLAALQAGQGTDLKFAETLTVNRQQKTPGISEEANKKLFALAESAQAQYVGASNDQGGYSIIKLNKINPANVADANKVKTATQKLNQQQSGDLVSSYFAALKTANKIEYSKDAEKKLLGEDKAGKDNKDGKDSKESKDSKKS